jgi:hypothetical protein
MVVPALCIVSNPDGLSSSQLFLPKSLLSFQFPQVVIQYFFVRGLDSAYSFYFVIYSSIHWENMLFEVENGNVGIMLMKV